MNLAEPALEVQPRSAPSYSRTVEAAVRYRRSVYFACVLLAVACNYVLGKDMAWDTLNYHFYLGFSALHDRFTQDYFAAGMLSYLNPYAYVPFYLMARTGLPALLICSVFAAAHSIILWLSFELGVIVCPSKDDRARLFAGLCAIALAFMNPILMQQIGSCFADITTAELALGGWLLLAYAVRKPQISRVVYAGLILGAASALKLSNALAAISAVVMLAMLPVNWRDKIRYAFSYGVALGAGVVVVAAPWSYRLAQVFGNPMFPMFNNFFRSPEFTTESAGSAYRFIPDSISEALWRPFAMIDPYQMVHEELSAPDPRYAIIVVLVTLLIVRWLQLRLTKKPVAHVAREMNDATRVLWALGLGLIVYWTLWLRVSGNSRYVLTMASVAGAVIVGILFQQLETRLKMRNYIFAAIFASQAVQLYMGAEYRWNGVPWGAEWFDISLPKKLETESNLFLTLGTQSNSFLAPFVSRDSGFINIAGGYTLDPDGANGDRVRALMHKFSPNVRAIFELTKPFEKYQDKGFLSQIDDAVAWYNLRVDRSDCSTIAVHGVPPELEIRYGTTLPQETQDRETSYLGTCRLLPDSTDRSALLARQQDINVVLNRMEDACPELFQPRRPLTVHFGDVWRRIYGATDIVAWVNRGRLRFSNQIRAQGVTDVGSESDWAKGPLRLECGRRDGVDFARVLR